MVGSAGFYSGQAEGRFGGGDVEPWSKSGELEKLHGEPLRKATVETLYTLDLKRFAGLVGDGAVDQWEWSTCNGNIFIYKIKKIILLLKNNIFKIKASTGCLVSWMTQ